LTKLWAQSLPTGGASRTRSSWLAISSTPHSLGVRGTTQGLVSSHIQD
jgi:hypothetical protein